MERNINNYFKNNFLVTRFFFSEPSLAIKMHTHDSGQSHITEVISGSIRVIDETGLDVIVKAGEIIDLRENLKHEIYSLENETIIDNKLDLSHYSEEELSIIEEEYSKIKPKITTFCKKNKFQINDLLKLSYVLLDKNKIQVTILADFKDSHSVPSLSFISIEDEKLILNLNCDEGNLSYGIYEFSEIFEFYSNIKHIVVKWLNDRATTQLDIF